MNLIKITTRLTLVLASIPALYSCQKSSINNDPKMNEAQTEMTRKVSKWLQDQITAANAIKKPRLEALSNNVDYHSLRLESLNNNETFIVVPLKEVFQSQFKKPGNSIDHLVLIQAKNGSIRDGKVIQFFQTGGNSTNKFPANTFHKIYNGGELEIDGKFRALTVTDKFLYELTFDSGKMQGWGLLESKEKTAVPGENNRTTECTNWYVVTTYYYSDGTTYQTSEYVGTTCSDDESHEPPGDGGGSTENVSKSVQWVVGASAHDFWYVKSYETLYGVKDPTDFFKGRFTSIVHSTSSVFNNVSSSNPAYASWQQLYYLTSIPASYRTECTVRGKITYPNGNELEISKTMYWLFFSEWP